MLRYETLFLTVPEITQDESTAIESQFQKLIKDHSGMLISFERWGKMQLAYPIRHNDYGTYFLVRFEGSANTVGPLLEAIKVLFSVKLNDTVMRHLTSRLDEKSSLVYVRPESLEEIPGKTTDVLMKEHRVGMGSRRYEGRGRREDVAEAGIAVDYEN